MAVENKWTRRSFDFSFSVDLYPEILERLRCTPARLEDRIRSIPPEVLTRREGERWSIQEHAGHLFDLEPLFMHRLDEFEMGIPILSPADMTNRRTYEARHNEKPIDSILISFRAERRRLIQRLERWEPSELARTALHPRLNITMRVVDLMFFHAEHDDNHLARITALLHAFVPVR
jgi:uncharacterized damage-inducible protein DinB